MSWLTAEPSFLLDGWVFQQEFVLSLVAFTLSLADTNKGPCQILAFLLNIPHTDNHWQWLVQRLFEPGGLSATFSYPIILNYCNFWGKDRKSLFSKMSNCSFKFPQECQCTCLLQKKPVIFWCRGSLVRPLWYHNVRGSDLIQSFSCGTWGTQWQFEREAPYFCLSGKKIAVPRDTKAFFSLFNVTLHLNVLFICCTGRTVFLVTFVLFLTSPKCYCFLHSM